MTTSFGDAHFLSCRFEEYSKRLRIHCCGFISFAVVAYSTESPLLLSSPKQTSAVAKLNYSVIFKRKKKNFLNFELFFS
jgi:hypothetical protein